MAGGNRLIVVVLAALAVGVTFSAGQMTRTTAADAKTSGRSYTLRMGDKAVIPAIGQVCQVSAEGGAPDLICARSRNARHQVTFFRDNILVWKVGNPDHPVWSGKP